MPQRVLPEWSGEPLVYLSPSQAVGKFGYRGPGSRPGSLAAEREHFANIDARVPLQDGEPAAVRETLGTPAEAAARVKAVALESGARLVGITYVDPRYVYAGQDVTHRYAIAIAIAMDVNEILQVPRPEANAEYIRVYDAVGRVAVELAQRIRAWGHPARAHTVRKEQLAMLPHAYAAGLGELGKHGSLINRDLGSSFRVSVVTTDLPLAVDTPRLEGIDDFCAKCQMCVTYCPGDAISSEKQDVRGVLKWVVDTEKCAPYFATYYACAICLQVCPWNARAFEGHYRGDFIRTIKSMDAQELKGRLRAGLQQPWEFLPKPAPASAAP